MSYDQDDDALIQLAHSFAAGEMQPRAAHYDETEDYPHDIIEKAASVGLNNFDLPEQYGGAGIESLLTAARIEEELSWGDIAQKQTFRCWTVFAGIVLNLGTEDQKQRWIAPLSGPKPAYVGTAITEPDAGSDVAAIRTHARRVEGGYILNGQKTWCSNAPIADTYCVLATMKPGEGFAGFTAFIVKKGDPGFELSKKIPKLGVRAIPNGELFFNDCFVPADRLLGAECGALAGLNGLSERARIHIAASAIGQGRAALEYAVDYAKERRTFGHQIKDYQAVSFRLVDTRLKLDQARLMTHHAAKLFDQGAPCAIETSMAKVAASEAAWYAAWACCQTLGSYSYSREYPAERWLRNAKVEEIYEGTNDMHRVNLAAALFA